MKVRSSPSMADTAAATTTTTNTFATATNAKDIEKL
ncbi:hypothetical protein BVRB_6g144760 [Beta vulgaris subsp. vulgaris]|nr:hypothetical protein BVRB_6g144760 [Beta vulgaris subsp. vulgaris]